MPRFSPSFLWSVTPPDGGMLSEPWEYPQSTPRSRCHTIAPTEPPPWTFIPGSAPLLLSLLSTSLPWQIASELCAGLGRPPPNHCYCRWSYTPGMETPLTVVGYPHSSGKWPYLPQSSVVRYWLWDTFPLPDYISPTRSGGCLNARWYLAPTLLAPGEGV